MSTTTASAPVAHAPSVDDVDSVVTSSSSSEPVVLAQADPASQQPSAAAAAAARRRIALPSIPDDILNNAALNEAIKRLPSNYSFEVHKTLWRLRVCGSKKVALQLPEGLLMYACTLSDILERFGGVRTVIMGDVTYGACCIDDYTARALGCDFMVHYGHSCLVPVDVSEMNALYVFVDIGFSIAHLLACLRANLAPDTKLLLAGTIQFTAALHAARAALAEAFPYVLIPQTRPLSQGEVLGCTSPHLPRVYGSSDTVTVTGAQTGASASTTAPATESTGGCCGGAKKTNDSACCSSSNPESSASGSACCGSKSANADENTAMDISPAALTAAAAVSAAANATAVAVTGADSSKTPSWWASPEVCVFIADGRFHLESLMIHNPHIPRYLRYDPYTKILSTEGYDTATMHATRRAAIDTAQRATRWGVVLGTLGRQGSASLLQRIEATLTERGTPFVTVLLSEIFPGKLATLPQADAWVQIACPRLSIDWGSAFSTPLLSTYEFDVAMELAPWLPGGVYPMDFYSNDGGAWSNYHERQQERAAARAARSGAGAAAGDDGDAASVTVSKSSGKSVMALIKAKRAAARAKAAADAAAASEAAGAAASSTATAELSAEQEEKEAAAAAAAAVAASAAEDEFELAVDAAVDAGARGIELGDGITAATLQGGYRKPIE